MNTIRLSKGQILFDEFEETTINEAWTLMPNDLLRVSLTERTGYIRLYHGPQDIMLLTDEPDNYVLDLRNEYVPISSQVQSGVVVFGEAGKNLEVLEWYDETKEEYIVYQFIRIIRQGSIYTVYGRNTEVDRWELIASIPYEGSGKIGLIVKGPSDPVSLPFTVDYVRIYKSQQIQILNVPVGYRVDLCREGTGAVISSKRVLDPNNGAVLISNDIPTFRAYFRLYDEDGIGVHTSQVFDMCGGDIYYYGSTLQVLVNGEDMYQDEDYFLGYFQNSRINFVIELINPYFEAFSGVHLSAVQYMDDIGYEMVSFSLSEEGPFESEIEIGFIPGNTTMIVYGRVTRNLEVDPSDVKPYKFNLQVTNT